MDGGATRHQHPRGAEKVSVVAAAPGPDLTDAEDGWLRPPRTYKGSPLQQYHQAQRAAADAQASEEARMRALNAPMLAEAKKSRHVALIRHHSAKRRAAKKCSTPAWANMAAIEAIYAEAERRTRETGIPHHVDHEIPLTHPLVCGLHVEHNLRVLTALANIVKGNKFEPS